MTRPAQLRLPDPEDGTRDSSVPGAAPGALVVEVGSRHTAWLQGSSRVVVPLLTTLGLRWQYGTDGWAFPRRLVDDVLALCDAERRQVRLRSVER